MKRPNIILITVDCLRPDHLHCYGYKRNITPNIDNLAKSGILFKSAFSNAPYTSYSMPSFISSSFPPVVEIPKETIASILKKYGYATASFNPNTIILSKAAGGGKIRKGFDTFDLMLPLTYQYRISFEFSRQTIMSFFRFYFNKNGWIHNTVYIIYEKLLRSVPKLMYPKFHLYTPTANQINRQAIQWIEKQKTPFFLWLHYMDVHEPYFPPNPKNLNEVYYLISKYRDFPNMLTKQEIEKLQDLYDLEIEYVDKAVTSFLDELKKLNDYDDSIIIISADHGDAFGEHDTLGHGGKFKPQLYDEFLRVPLIIHGTKEKGKTINKQVQLLDLGPTICNLANIPIPPTFFGQSVFDSSHRGIIANCSTSIAYRTEHFKLIINKYDNEENELYNLKDDPNEKINIFRKNNEIVQKLENEMIMLLTHYKKKKDILYIKHNF